ncbi:hypothetical protein NEF87_003943 [Candidatus Lokiarchaeum ossiferum]|uniref:GTP-binding protein n=1 Tax=Candidatus Lokiarchaeum ossiferum TaxID=2951803 RepID=A0ABY6HWC9_9ARCH|nr:hypothetical protein NEF87_003943 [Candidatus Lokiarchaeum sp. B-35]
MSEIPVMKVFFAGEGGVGKSTMVERIVTGIFNDKLIMTIGVNHAVKTMKTDDGRDVTLQIWDIGGEDRFRFVVQSYVKGSSAGVIAFDTTRMSTYLHLTHWLDIIRETIPSAPLFLVGMKSDLDTANLDRDQYKELVEKYHLEELIFTSSKTGENIEETFQKLANCLPQIPQYYRKAEEA